jgi:hypothetical protein
MLFVWCADVAKSRFHVLSFFLAIILAMVPATKSEAGFIYTPIIEPILGAQFSADFAALVAHRYIAGEEVNMLKLAGTNGDVLDLSSAFFGASELLNGDIPSINQGPLETHIFSAAIPASFFPALLTGQIGLSFLFTDADDGLFAMDFLSLEITTGAGVIEAFMDTNDGYKIGLADNASLSDPLPVSIQIGATGTGFDEAISSKAHNDIPEPASMSLFGIGLLALLGLLYRDNLPCQSYATQFIEASSRKSSRGDIYAP